MNAERLLVVRMGDAKFSAPLAVASKTLYEMGGEPVAADQLNIAAPVAGTALSRPPNDGPTMYVKPFVRVDVIVLVPVGLIYGADTATFTIPEELAGVVAVIVLVLTRTTLVAGMP